MNTFFEWFLLAAIVILVFRVISLEERLKNISYTLQQVAQQVGVDKGAVDEEIKQLLVQGKDIEAVKFARESLGLSLVDGKQYVDALKDET